MDAYGNPEITPYSSFHVLFHSFSPSEPKASLGLGARWADPKVAQGFCRDDARIIFSELFVICLLLSYKLYLGGEAWTLSFAY